MREEIEWTRSWCVNCNDTKKPRVLLVGDSICDGYYYTVYENLEEKFNVDKLVTSRSIASDMYRGQLELFMNDFRYDIISFNNGLHGFHLSSIEYKVAYESILDLFKDTKTLLVLSTPLMKKDNLSEYDEENNEIVLQRNDVVRKIAVERRLEVLDIYSAVDKNAEIRAEDGTHYLNSGYKIIGKLLADKIKNMV